MNKKLKRFLVALSLCTLILPNFQVITVTSIQEDSVSIEASLDSTLEIVDLAEDTDQLSSEEAANDVVSLEESSVLEEVIEESSSQENSEELPVTSEDETHSLPQVFYQVLDDNTIYLAGTTGEGLEVRLTDSHSQVLASTVSYTNGEFQLVLAEVLAANQQVVLEVIEGETVLWSDSFVVKLSGLAYEMIEVENTWLFDIVSSPNRLIELSDVEGVVITSAQTNEHGFAQLQVEKALEIASPLKLSVYDKDRPVRSIEVNLDESAFVLDSVDSSFNQVQVANTSIVDENDVFVITEVKQEVDGLRIKGYIKEEAASGGLLTSLLEWVVGLLFGEPTYYLTVNNSSEERSIENNQFEFLVIETLEVGAKIPITLRAKGRRLLGSFDEPISSLDISIPGQKINTLPQELNLQKTIQYEDNLLITRSDSQDLSERTQDYIIDVFDNTSNDWYLYAEAVRPLTNENDFTLDGSLFFKDGQSLNPLENRQVLVGSEAQAVNVEESVYRFSWPASEGIVIQTNPFYTQSDTTYTTQIRWTISNTP